MKYSVQSICDELNKRIGNHFEVMGDFIYYQEDFDMNDWDADEFEPHDVAWDIYCNTAGEINHIIGKDNWEKKADGTDHDTVCFEIHLIGKYGN